MKRAQIRQLAELAEATRDADLMAKAIRLLLEELDRPEAMPLFQQPAVRLAEISLAGLDNTLDNLPALLVKQPAVEVVEKQDLFDVPTSVANALAAWRRAFGDAWRSNSEAFGYHQHRDAMHEQINSWLDLAVEADQDPGMTIRYKAKTFWERVRMLKPDGYRVEHRTRDCGTYHVKEHRVLEVPKLRGGDA